MNEPVEAIPGEQPGRLATAAVPATSAALAPAPRARFGSAIRALTRAIPTAIYRLQQLGPLGVVGLAGVLTSTIVALTALVSLQSATTDLRAKLATPHHPTLATARPEDELEHLLATLPDRNAMPGVLGEIEHQATLAGVTLTGGHYTYSPAKSGSVGSYELEFPIEAGYPGVRDFINRTLTAVPAAALDKLHLERKSVGDTVVSADVRFVVFVKGGTRE